MHESLGTPRDRDNTDRHRLGVRYEQPRWMVGFEGEIFDDSVEPYDALHLTGRASLFRSRMHTLDTRIELSRYAFEGGLDDRQERIESFKASGLSIDEFCLREGVSRST